MSKTTVGACGEHYVASYLSRLGLLVALPRGGVPGSDLFVARETNGPPIRVQVKTGTDSKRKTRTDGEIYLWQTSDKVIAGKDASLWYAYVWLNDWLADSTKSPEVFFVPSADVVACMEGVVKEREKYPKAWSYFWMKVENAKKYKGCEGVKPLMLAAGFSLDESTFFSS